MVEVTCSGLLFDLDGVLVDSNPAVARVWSKWAIEHGFDPDEIVRKAHGRPSLATVRDLLPNSDAVKENEVILRGEIEDTEGVVALPGARELLASLPEERWAVVTSCSRPLAEVRLKVSGLPIPKRMITSDDVRRGKPDPEPYRKGAELLGFPASKCVVFEDASAGVRAGKAAGALVIGLTSSSPGSDLEKAGADWILPGYRNLTVMSSDVISSDHGSNTLKLALNL
jgi:mannitol-1-/sugar-/sorbitol-6-phosphatase